MPTILPVNPKAKVLLASLPLLFFLHGFPAIAEAQPKNTVLPPVAAGPLEAERLALLEKLQAAKMRGIEIESFLSAFAELESMAKKRCVREDIQAKLNQISSDLTDRLENRKKPVVEVPSTKPSAIVKTETLTLSQARQFALKLVNRDRARYHQAPLRLDTIASRAGQMHTDEMAKLNYCSHWDTSGRKPYQRYTESGGTHESGENLAICSGMTETPGPNLFTTDEIETLHALFMIEKPPEDGHRVQILRPEHNKMGVGLSRARDAFGRFTLCLAQEFVDEYGTYSILPLKLTRGKPVLISGTLNPGIKIYGMAIRREAKPQPMTLKELRATKSYGLPPAIEEEKEDEPAKKEELGKLITSWTKDKRQRFRTTLNPDNRWKSGLYYVIITAQRKNAQIPIVVSTRTMLLD
ncbi:MAG: CAP domain-containing protein [Candidatus Obscuribacter sp.]|nr:CAP domain-containing protein [Candidatus Obscuribacter sp.]